MRPFYSPIVLYKCARLVLNTPVVIFLQTFDSRVVHGTDSEVFHGCPVWWIEVAVNPTKNHIIGVAQKTVVANYEKLILPAIEVFEDWSAVLVIAALRRKGASLPAVTVIQTICEWQISFLTTIYANICAVPITIAGYGGTQHGVCNGIPMVVTGDSDDKA